MRGEQFHRYLVAQAARAFQDGGFKVALECPQRCPDGGTAFIDLVASRRQHGSMSIIACEVETTPRNAMRNIRKVQALELPLLVLVPSRTVKLAVLDQLRAVPDSRICVLLLSELPQALADCFSSFPAANGQGKTGKPIIATNHGGSAPCA